MTEKIEFSDDEIEPIRSNIEDKEFVEETEMKKLIETRTKSAKDSIALADLFIACYNYIDINNIFFFEKDDDKDGKTEQKLYDYLDSFTYLEELRRLMEDYGSGQEYGSYYNGENIKGVVKEHRKDMSNLINLFFRIFSEEE